MPIQAHPRLCHWTYVLDTVIINFCQLGSHCNLQVAMSQYYDMNRPKVMICHAKNIFGVKRCCQVK